MHTGSVIVVVVVIAIFVGANTVARLGFATKCVVLVCRSKTGHEMVHKWVMGD